MSFTFINQYINVDSVSQQAFAAATGNFRPFSIHIWLLISLLKNSKKIVYGYHVEEHPRIVWSQLSWTFCASWNISYMGLNPHWIQCKKWQEIAIPESKIYYLPLSAITELRALDYVKSSTPFHKRQLHLSTLLHPNHTAPPTRHKVNITIATFLTGVRL